MHDTLYDGDGDPIVADQQQEPMDPSVLTFAQHREEEWQRALLYGWYKSVCAFCQGECPEHALNTEGSRLVQNFVKVAGGSRRFGDMPGLICGLFQAYPMRLIDAARVKTSDDPCILTHDVYVAAWSLELHFPPPDPGEQWMFN